MKRFLPILSFVLIASFLIMGKGKQEEGGIQFFEGTYQDARIESINTGKVLFVDAMAQWCGPCKKMKKKVFSDDKVAAFFNENFINYQLDTDTQEGKKYKNEWNVSMLPTLLFVNPDGTLQEFYEGYAEVPKLLMIGEKHKEAK